jgi:hypothetical protein
MLDHISGFRVDDQCTLELRVLFIRKQRSDVAREKLRLAKLQHVHRLSVNGV